MENTNRTSSEKTEKEEPKATAKQAHTQESRRIPTHAEVERYSRRHRKDDGFSHVLLFYILPFIVVNVIIFLCVTSSPKFTLETADTENYLTTQIILTVDSHFPLKSVTASMDGEELPLQKSARRTYMASVSKNGVIEATVTNRNGMSIVQYEHIDVLDDTPPAFADAVVEEGVVTLTVYDSQSGINFESVYALNSLGEEVAPILADRDTNTFSFSLDPNGLYVHAQDRAGNEVQGTFTSHMAGEDAASEESEVEL